MSDLLRRIQQAQVEAGESAVVEDLRRKGLLPPEPKLGIAINLDQLRQLMREFVNEQEPDPDKRVGLEWTMEIFLQWLRRKRQETMSDESENSSTNLRLIAPVNR